MMWRQPTLGVQQLTAMARPASDHPTGLELEILKLLWLEHPQPVRQIRDRLAKTGRDNAHTSVITMLNIMVEKGYLAKQKEGKSFVYWPIVSQELISRSMVSDLVTRVFDGSAKRLVLNLIDHEEVDEAELLELRKLINRKVKEQRE